MPPAAAAAALRGASSAAFGRGRRASGEVGGGPPGPSLRSGASCPPVCACSCGVRAPSLCGGRSPGAGPPGRGPPPRRRRLAADRAVPGGAGCAAARAGRARRRGPRRDRRDRRRPAGRPARAAVSPGRGAAPRACPWRPRAPCSRLGPMTGFSTVGPDHAGRSSSSSHRRPAPRATRRARRRRPSRRLRARPGPGSVSASSARRARRCRARSRAVGIGRTWLGTAPRWRTTS